VGTEGGSRGGGTAKLRKGNLIEAAFSRRNSQENKGIGGERKGEERVEGYGKKGFRHARKKAFGLKVQAFLSRN